MAAKGVGKNLALQRCLNGEDEDILSAFLAFSQSEYNEMNLLFWLAANAYATAVKTGCGDSARRAKAGAIYLEFLADDSPSEICLACGIADGIASSLSEAPPDLFTALAANTFRELARDSFPRFLAAWDGGRGRESIHDGARAVTAAQASRGDSRLSRVASYGTGGFLISGDVVKNGQKRFLWLSPQALGYSKHAGERKPRGIIPLSDVQRVELLSLTHPAAAAPADNEPKRSSSSSATAAAAAAAGNPGSDHSLPAGGQGQRRRSFFFDLGNPLCIPCLTHYVSLV
jgi:hypothetical protein